jgi:hypothetical protein
MSHPKRSPLSPGSDITEAGPEVLQEQLRFEVGEVKANSEVTNLELALDLGFAGEGSVSKWLNGHGPVSEKGALALDALGHVPTIGGSFAELQRAYIRARRRGGPRRRRKPGIYDVFLSSPMASVNGTGAYAIERAAANDLKAALEDYCDMTVYYAGGDIESQEEFDSPVAAAEANFEALRTATYFVLLTVHDAPEPDGGPPLRPTSVHVEAGFALAENKPSLYLVRDHDSLPFMLRQLGEHSSKALPRVSVEKVDSGQRAISLIRHHGIDLLGRLAGKASSSRGAGGRARRQGRDR